MVCATSKALDQPAHMRSLIRAFASRLNILCVLLIEHHLEFLSLRGGCTGSFLSLKGGCTGSSERTLVKKPHYWKSDVTAHMLPENNVSLIITGDDTCQLTCNAAGTNWFTVRGLAKHGSICYSDEEGIFHRCVFGKCKVMTISCLIS